MGSKLSSEKRELYENVLETYKQALRANPELPFTEHCRKWNVRADKLGVWLNNANIFISDLKRAAREQIAAEQLRHQQQQRGTFVPVCPENEIMSGWRSTTIPRVEIYLPGKVRLSVKNGTVKEIISLISTYSEKGGQH